MKKRLIACFLSATMICSAVLMLASCADNGSSKPGSSTGDVSGTGNVQGTDDINQLKPGIPEGLRFDADGEKTPINFLIAETDAGAGDSFHLRSIKLEADEVVESDKVDVAVAARNAVVEDTLGVEIVVYEYLTSSNIRSSAAYTAISAQSEEYDVLAGLQWSDIDISLDGTLVDLNAMIDEEGNKIDYLSLDKPWWSGYYIDSLKLGSSDALYWVTGDLCLRYTGGYYCFFVNETLYKQDLLNTQSDLLTQKYNTPTNYGNIYDLVAKGDWTLDIFNEMISKAYHDDGDNKVNTTDVLGAALPIWDNTNGMSVAAGVEYSQKSSDTVSLLANSGNSRLINFMTKMNKILKSGYIYNYGGDYKRAFTDFSNDLSCFVGGRLNQAELYLTNMVSNYHIIPCPKMDFDQKEYRSSVHDGINLYGISYYSLHKAASAATMELMAYLSYTNVRPIYYDQALKNLYTTDEGAAYMIDLMHDVVYSDFVYIWQFSDYFGNKNGGGGLGDFLRNTVSSSKPSSQIKRNQDMWKSGLEELLQEIEKLENT